MPEQTSEGHATLSGVSGQGPFHNLIDRVLRLPSPGEGSVAFWRKRIMELMIIVGAFLGMLAYVPSVLLSLRVGLWSVAVVDTLAYGWVVAAALSPRWRYQTRVGGLMAVLYLIALVLLVRIGTAGAGLLWISALPVMAAILIGLRAALLTWLLAVATLAGCGWVAASGAMAPAAMVVPQSIALAAWVVNSANALFLSALMALPTAVLLRGLEHAHRALAREEERFSKIFHLSPEPVGITRHADGRFLAVNSAWSSTFGWTREEALGRTAADLGLWGAGADQDGLRSELAATGGIAPQAMDLCCKDGRALPVLLSGKVMDLEGETCLLIMAQDLTASRQAERELRRLETELLHAQKLESLGSLAGGVAHDMNNILAGILGLGSTLRDRHAGDAELVATLDLMLSAGDRGCKLVRSLTDFARKGLDDAGPVDLNDLIRNQVTLLQSTTLQKIELVQELAPNLPPVLGELSALSNAVMNLCVNAIDAMPEGGILSFHTRMTAAGKVELAVADTGEGMTPAVQARAMEPFFTTKAVGKGTGLGLAGVYGTMKAHGGTVELQSRVGQGTRILLRFPAYVPTPAICEPQAERPPETAGTSLRILLVDDDPIIQETMPSILAYLEHTVQVASRGQEALDLLQDGLEVDLVILDHNMPGLSGAETLVRLKAMRPGLPVLLSTGFLEASVEALVKACPGVWLLNKPYSMQAIRDKIRLIRELQAV
jgi:PAS domain S-box-containing protein